MQLVLFQISHEKYWSIGEKNKQNNKNDFLWDDQLDDYIGWSACSYQSHSYLPNGLYCGLIGDNIFCKNKFIYSSNNENYKNRLPAWKKDDIVVLQYDSDFSILSFSKENDNGQLDSCISNLPNQQTFYWFVGHCVGEMSLTCVFME